MIAPSEAFGGRPHQMPLFTTVSELGYFFCHRCTSVTERDDNGYCTKCHGGPVQYFPPIPKPDPKHNPPK